MPTTSTIHLIAQAVTNYMVETMQTEVNSDDDTRAGLVRMGPLQASPLTSGGINILTQFNDLESDKGWRHAIVSGPGDMLGFKVLPYEVGGGQMWVRRYTTLLTCFFRTSVLRAKAEELAQIILSRAEQAVLEAPLPQGVDSFGELALEAFIHSSINHDRGGPGQIIFDGQIWWQVLTEKTRN